MGRPGKWEKVVPDVPKNRGGRPKKSDLPGGLRHGRYTTWDRTGTRMRGLRLLDVPEIGSRVAAALSNGERLKELSRELGIGPFTIHHWIGEGQKEARKISHMAFEVVRRAAAAGDWRAAAALLELRFRSPSPLDRPPQDSVPRRVAPGGWSEVARRRCARKKRRAKRAA